MVINSGLPARPDSERRIIARMAPKNAAKIDASRVAVDELTAAQAKAEHARLEAEIAAHDRRYYQDDAPSVSDA